MIGEAAPVVRPEPVKASIATSPPALPPPPLATHGTPWRLYLAGGIGTAGLLVGAITGAMTFAKKSEVQSECTRSGDTGPYQCSDKGLAAVSTGRDLGLASSIAWGVAGAGLGAAVLLYFKEARTTPNQTAGWRWSVSMTGTALTLEARY